MLIIFDTAGCVPVARRAKATVPRPFGYVKFVPLALRILMNIIISDCYIVENSGLFVRPSGSRRDCSARF